MVNNTVTYQFGPGVKFVVFLLGVVLLLAIGYGAGMIHKQVKQDQTTIKVLNTDSIIGHDISEETARLKNETDEFLKTHDPYDKHGRPTDEWLQFIRSQRNTARERGDQGGFFSNNP